MCVCLKNPLICDTNKINTSEEIWKLTTSTFSVVICWLCQQPQHELSCQWSEYKIQVDFKFLRIKLL